MIDPAPRTYPDFVRLQRRSATGGGAAIGTASVADVEEWLLADAIALPTTLELFEGFCWRLVAAGILIDRAILNSGTLHPQLVGLTWQWQAGDGLCDELQIPPDVLESQQYRQSPLYRVIEHGETVRGDLQDPETVKRYPLFQDLAAAGMASYLAMPLTIINPGLSRKVMTITLASRERNSLFGPSLDALEHLLKLLTPHIARLMAEQMAANIATAYLGKAASRQVLDGSIQRGAGSAIEAVILVADLRRFTELSGRLPPADMLSVLNAFFDPLVAAIEAKGGEVLKFMGDGLLAVFPVDAAHSRRDSAARAYAAASQALAAVEALNEDRPSVLSGLTGWRPLEAGLALHLGEVFFGNVGAPGRLDFTVVGPAVNIAARVESMTKEVGRPLLLTEPVAGLLRAPTDALGAYSLRGVKNPVALFAPSNAAAK